MYSTCLFCNADLGANEVIEHFPVGRRLAFDAANGRLWVVCRRCERWNLTPLEERWEAIEECERLFTDTRLRVSTDNIGLARLREGLELVRIGRPMRPEMAAWRYGDQFGRRRRNYLILSGVGVVAAGGLVTAGAMTGVIAGGGWGLFQGARALVSAYQKRRLRTRIRLPGSAELIAIRARQLDSARVAPENDGWSLRIDTDAAPRSRSIAQIRRHVIRREHARPDEVEERVLEALGLQEERSAPIIYRGHEAVVAAGKLLPLINSKGARTAEVQDAVSLIGTADSSDNLFERYAGAEPAMTFHQRHRAKGRVDTLTKLPAAIRLALEMAAHEEQERRALEGELAILEAAWRDAEEIARISDDMFLPDDVTARVAELKTRG